MLSGDRSLGVCSSELRMSRYQLGVGWGSNIEGLNKKWKINNDLWTKKKEPAPEKVGEGETSVQSQWSFIRAKRSNEFEVVHWQRWTPYFKWSFRSLNHNSTVSNLVCYWDVIIPFSYRFHFLLEGEGEGVLIYKAQLLGSMVKVLVLALHQLLINFATFWNRFLEGRDKHFCGSSQFLSISE